MKTVPIFDIAHGRFFKFNDFYYMRIADGVDSGQGGSGYAYVQAVDCDGAIHVFEALTYRSVEITDTMVEPVEKNPWDDW